MKDSAIALSIASVVTILAGVPLYYGSNYLSHGSYGYNHGKKYSKGHHGGHGHHDDLYYVLRLKEQLGLTEDLVTQINSLKFEHKKRKIDFQKDHKIAQMEIERELNSETLSESEVRRLASHIGNLKRKNIEENFEARLNIIRLLTTEQKKKVKQILENPKEGSNRKSK